MIDAIGHPIQIGDYVTAVWANGYVALFEVVDIKTKGRYRRKMVHEDFAMLKRLFRDNYTKQETQDKPVKKFSEQITWVDPSWVMLHFLSK